MLKRVLSVASICFIFVLLLSLMPGGLLDITANAATSGNYTYTVSNGKATITDCDTSIQGAVTIPSKLGGYPVTSIGYNAFTGCSSLTSITIPNGVTSIGYNAFYGCSSLTSITIPDSVTSIGSSAFYGCSSLTSITIPGGVTSIDSYAFYKCSSLTSITIPNGVTRIGSDAFFYCTGLTSVTIGNGVTSIGDYAFYHCSGLTKMTYCDTIAKWHTITKGANWARNTGDLVFCCSDVEEVTATSYLMKSKEAFASFKEEFSINEDYFASLKELINAHSLECNNSTCQMEELGDRYEECYNSYMHVENEIERLDTEIINLENAKEFDIQKMDAIIADIARLIDSYGDYDFLPDILAFYEKVSDLKCHITSIVIPDGVTVIGYAEFRGATAATSVTIPDSVTTISSSAFEGCSSLTSVTIPDSVTSIGSSAFSGCSSLTSITIPDSVTNIGRNAFYNTAWYDNQPDGLIYAGKIAYRLKGTCPSSVTIKEGTSGIAEYAFYNCSSLTSITIPGSVTSIGSSAFSGCSSLTSITIPDSVTSIGDNAFYNTAWYDNQPDGLTYVGKIAYKLKGTCPSSITMKEGTLGIAEYAFYNCSSLTGITIPDSVTSIGYSAFRNCSSLTSITIPNGVTSIGDYAFYYCSSLTSIIIGDGVTSIGNDAFYNCNKLSHVAYTGSQSQWNRITFGSSNSKLTKATRHYETEFLMVDNCVELGVYCQECQVFLVRMEKPGGVHSFVEATCTAPKTCTVCGAVEGDPLSHSYKAATCTAPKTCTACGVTEGTALGHSGDLWFDIVPLTCTTDGIKARICSTCGMTETQVIAALGHTNTSVVTPPTCEDKGYTTNTCAVCGVVTVTDYVDATGHDYSTVEIAPTCTEKGSVTKTCATCGDVVIEEIAAKGHGWSAWIQTAAPSCKAEGTRVRFCNCGTRETEVLPKLPHSFEDDICTVCGKKTVDLKITAVTLRPEAAGLYFTGSFEIAENVSVVRQGIVVSVYSSMPVADGSDPNSLWSAGTTSVMVKNILRANLKDTSNQNRAAMPIYARAYVELEDGTYIYSDVSAVNLQEVVEAADGQWNTLDAIQKEAFLAMYKKFQAILQAWSIPNVKKV